MTPEIEQSRMMNVSTGLTLDELNEEETQYYMGGTIFVGILAATGIIGNIHVLLIYTFYMKQSNHRIFIVCLGVLDLITCTIGMPFVIVNFRKPLTFTDDLICKILTFYNFFICLSSACVLIVIAVDRYRKICKPHAKQMSQKAAKIMCLVAMVIALLFSWPALIMYGSTPAKTRDPFIDGRECNLLIEVRSTMYPLIFNGLLLIVAISSFIILAILYTVIGKVIWKHRSFESKTDDTHTEVTGVKDTTDHGFKSVTFHSGSSDEITSQQTSQVKQNGNEEKVTETNGSAKKSPRRTSLQTKIEMRRRSSTGEAVKTSGNRKSLQKALSKFDRTKRTTMMLFWITIVFFISYVPYLVLRIVFYTNPNWYPSMTFTGKVTYNTLLWCVYMNNMANSVIYGFCDQRFRQKAIYGYQRAFCRQKWSVQPS